MRPSSVISHLDGHVQGLEILEHVVRERSSARVPSLSSLETQRLVNLGQNHLLGNPEKLLLADQIFKSKKTCIASCCQVCLPSRPGGGQRRRTWPRLPPSSSPQCWPSPPNNLNVLALPKSSSKFHLHHLLLDLFIDSRHPKEKGWLRLDQSLKNKD